MKHPNKKRVVFGLLILLLSGALLGFTPNNASSFRPSNHQQNVLVLNASDADTDADETESEEDDDDEWDDEWEA